MLPLEALGSYVASAISFPLGARAVDVGPRPVRPLELYDLEGSPECRRVREALTMLDLEVMIYPCPEGGTRYRSVPGSLKKPTVFPFLVDPNTGRVVYFADRVIRYLFTTYGSGRIPWLAALGPISGARARLSTLARRGRGVAVAPSRPATLPLNLYGYEASASCRRVREALTSLELPYHLVNVAPGGPAREAFVRRTGSDRVPYLVDPNQCSMLTGARAILRHLDERYRI